MSLPTSGKHPSAVSEDLLDPSMIQSAQSSVRSERPSDSIERLDTMSGNTLRSARLDENVVVSPSTSRNSSTSITERAALIEFGKDSQARTVTLSSVDLLQKHLDEPYESGPRRRLYLLEGAQTGHARRLAKHFKIEQRFFQKHRRCPSNEFENRGRTTTLLPSLVDPHKTWCLTYHALRLFEEEWKSNWIRCGENGRRIELSRINGRLDETGIIERKASYWSKKYDKGGWDAIIVVDESIQTVEIGGPDDESRTTVPIQSRPYQGGYRNFVDDPVDLNPPQTTIFDDILFYVEHHSDYLRINDDPLNSTIFLQKIVASHYMMLIKYVKSLLNHLSFRLSQRTNLGELDSTWVEGGWSDLQVWNWRCNKYCQRVEAIIRALGIGENDYRRGYYYLSPSLEACTADFRGIHKQLVGLRRRSEMLASDFNGVASIVMNREALKEANRSIQEARSVRLLTLLGMLFLPLSFSSSLLSMSTDYLPGAHRFWLYFAIAIPLILFISVLSLLVTLIYGGEQNWVVRRYTEFCKWRRPRSIFNEKGA